MFKTTLQTGYRTSFFMKVLLVSFLCLPSFANAQCAMCRAALESSESGIQAEAVNDGIVYLMVIPYILVAVIAYAIYSSRIKKAE